MSGNIKVKFKKIDNTECELVLPHEILIEDMKDVLAKNEKINIPADQMRVLYKAKLLKDGHKLNEYVTEDMQTIHVIQKPAQAQAASGGPQGAQQPQGARLAGQPPGMPQGMPPFMMHMGGPGAPPVMHMGGPLPGDGRQGGGPPPFGGLLSQLLQGPPGGGAQGAQPGQPPPMPNLSGLLNSFMVPPPQAAGGPQNPPEANNEAGAAGSGSGQADGQQRNADEMANNLLGAIGDAANMISTQIRERQAAQRQQQQQPQAADVQGQPQPGAQPRPPAAAGSGSGAAAGGGGNTHVMQLPHQALIRIGQVCNSMQGPNTNFPGPPMPQLQVERNTVVLLGSYLTNLNLQLQRLAPMMSRTGDLMQRESLLTSDAERQLTQQMANDLGQALEDIARATGSVAHFYKTLEMGRSGAEAKLNVRGYQPSFQAIVDEVQSVRAVPRPQQQQQPRQQDAVMRSSLQDDEEEKQPDVDFASLPPPLQELRSQLSGQEMMMLLMGANDALNHLPRKAHDFLQKKKRDYNGSYKKYAEHVYTELAKELSNDEVRDQIHEGFDPTIALEEPLVEGFTRLCAAASELDPNQTWTAYQEPLKPKVAQALGVCIEELKDGFTNEEEGVFNWIQANAVRHFQKSLPPQQRGMAMMKAGPVLMMIRNQYQQYRQRKAAGEYDRPAEGGASSQPAASQQPAPERPTSDGPQVSSLADKEGEDAEMKQEEEKADGGEEQAQAQPPSQPMNMALLAKYKDVLHQDKQKIKNADEQMPHSRAYTATCSFTKSKKLPISEEKLLEKEYKASREKALQGLNVEHIVRDKIRKNLITGAGYPQAKVEEQLAKVEEIPEELVEAYVKMQRNLIKFRLANDPDFKRSRHPDAPNDSKQFEHLNDF